MCIFEDPDFYNPDGGPGPINTDYRLSSVSPYSLLTPCLVNRLFPAK